MYIIEAWHNQTLSWKALPWILLTSPNVTIPLFLPLTGPSIGIGSIPSMPVARPMLTLPTRSWPRLPLNGLRRLSSGRRVCGGIISTTKMSFLPPLIDGRRFAVSPYTVRVYDDGRRRRRRKSFDSKGLRQFFKANGVPKVFLFIYLFS